MLLFRSEEHVERWLLANGLERGGSMTLEQCQRLGQAWYHDKASANWRRKTLEEARGVFEEIGLVGEFWRLG